MIEFLNSQPLLALLVIISMGYFIGRVKIKGFSIILGIMLGILIGLVPVSIGELFSIKLGVTGGILLAGLILSNRRNLGPITPVPVVWFDTREYDFYSWFCHCHHDYRFSDTCCYLCHGLPGGHDIHDHLG